MLDWKASDRRMDDSMISHLTGLWIEKRRQGERLAVKSPDMLKLGTYYRYRQTAGGL